MSPPWTFAPLSGARYSAAELSEADDALYLLDQRRLPEDEIYLTLRDVDATAAAIRDMVVRGAPAIGIAAAYGLVLAARAAPDGDGEVYGAHMRRAGERLEAARPTAVNLSWAVRRCLAAREAAPGERVGRLAAVARAIHREDVAACRALGHLGARAILEERGVAAGAKLRVMTHCNAGALATGGYGTALGVVRALFEAGALECVYACETRPYLQGARLTAWELAADGVPVTVIGDAMAGHVMQRGDIAAVIVGADRIARNGDVANKIGTYGLACLAAAHGVPMWVAAPWSTVDLATPTGAGIVIEERAAEELSWFAGRRLVPEGAGVYNPAFDVTPARLIAGIITERGIFAPAALAESAG